MFSSHAYLIMDNLISQEIHAYGCNYKKVFNMNALSQKEIQQMFQQTHNLCNVGIVPVGHFANNVWVFLDKDNLPPQECPKHGDIMTVYKTEDDDSHNKEGTLFYRCNTNGCLENVYPLYSRHQLNQDLALATANPPAILY